VKLRRLAIFLSLAVMAAGARDDPHEIRIEQKFQAGGNIEVKLSSGGYLISGADSDTVSVTYSCDSPGMLREIKVAIKTQGSNASISVGNTPDNHNFHATIEVPRRSALWVRLTAGDLRLEGVEGDKDVEVRAGNIEIEVPHPDEYGHRDASVTAGDLDASVFNVTKGGLWRSFRQSGPGKYRLHAHLMAGNISFVQGN
jgi:hypothetical protein